MANPANSVVQNLLPVQAYFDVYGNFQTFIGQGKPFYATINPIQSGLTITNSTIDSSIIGGSVPAAGYFTSIATTTGTIANSPVNAIDIANKLYVDTVAQGLNPKAACKVGTLTNITLSGLQTIDGYSVLAGNRVLVKNQSNTPDNGIYVASASAWTRAVDMDVWAEVPGAYTVLLNGSQANTGWVSTSADTGTIGVTPITFVQFSALGTYYAGTGLTLSANTFSITNTGVTAATYGSASSVPVVAVNAQGQITSATNTSIAIGASQITSGTIASSLISGSYTGITGVGTLTVGTWNATPISNSYLANSSITINGNAVSLGGSTTVTANTPNSVTFNNSGTGGATGTTFNGSVAQTISYNTIGAPSTTGTGASGTWGIGITGNAGTVTNGVYTTGSYSNPSWITSILGSIVSGAVATATLATSATNIAGGSTGALPYNTGAGATSFLSLGTTNYVLTAGATAPQYVAQSTLSVGSATNATNATYLAGGSAGAVVWQSATGVTGFTAAGTTGQFLQSNGTGTPTWATPVSYATVTDDTTTNSTRYPLFANQTSGSLSTEYTSSTKLQYNPSTGVFTSTSFSGAGTGLTGTASSLSIGGNAATATTATSATTATNLAGGANGSVPYQTGSGATTFLAAGTNGYVMTLAGGVPTWAAAAGGLSITDDTTTNATRYPLFAAATSGSVSTEYTSSTNLQYTPNTGSLTALLLTSTGTATLGSASTTYIQVIGDASYPGVYAAGGTNTPLVLQPLGTGALQAQKTTSTATGGNARGANAVDWQTSRSAAGQVASGTYATIGGGIQNTANGFGSLISGGGVNNASVTYATIAGGNSNSSGSYSFIGGGASNSSLGYYNFVGGGFTNSGTSSASVTTQSGTMNGTTAVTLSGSNASIKVGQLIAGTSIANFTYVAAISGTALTLSQAASGSSTSTLSFYTPHGVVVGGGNNQATGSYSFIGGGGDAGTAANRNVASGDWSVVAGGIKNTAQALGSFIGGGGSNSTASFFSGNTIGSTGTNAAIVGGSGHNISNSYAVILGGTSNLGSGNNSAIIGGSYGTARTITGYTVFSAGNAPLGASSGLSQAALLVLARQTTDATATVLASDSSAAGTTNQVILPNNAAYYFKASIISGVTGGGNSKAWTIEGLIKRGANAASAALVGTPVVNTIAADTGASTWAIAATADTTNGGLAITFTGQAATTIRTVCKVETAEMTY